jgi:hypothetical protein
MPVQLRLLDIPVTVYPGRGPYWENPDRAFELDLAFERDLAFELDLAFEHDLAFELDLALAPARASYRVLGHLPAHALVEGPGSAQELASAPSPASALSGVGGV